MKCILVGIDGSEQGWAALDSAGRLAHALAAKLEIVYVSPQLPPAVAMADMSPGTLAWLETEEGYARGLLRQAVARVKDHGVETSSLSKTGPAAEELAELARSPDVVMAVVGHRGRNLAARLLVGSVADRLVQICPKPVLVVR